MDLNDNEHFSDLDIENMLAHIEGLPSQLIEAWQLGHELPLPKFQSYRLIVLAGMGGSAIGGDLLAAYLSDKISIPLIIHRDYGLPAYAEGLETLVITSSHSGNTEEVLSAFEEGQSKGCQLIAVCTGGKLAAKALQAGVPLWKFSHFGQPRTAVGFSFGLLLALVTRLGLIPDPLNELRDAIEVMRELQLQIGAEIPVLKNPAKRHAGNMYGRRVTIFANGFLAPVARRWKTQLNEVAKAFASFEIIPEADHNTLTGICNPPEGISHELAYFIHARADHPRNLLRMEKTQHIMMLEGLCTDILKAKGDTRLAQIWSSLLFGDYLAYYLAIAYDTDPTPIPPIALLKEEMSG